MCVGEVIVGLDLGVRTMKRGEKARFILAPECAFGRLGVKPRIPPSATGLLLLT